LQLMAFTESLRQTAHIDCLDTINFEACHFPCLHSSVEISQSIVITNPRQTQDRLSFPPFRSHHQEPLLQVGNQCTTPWSKCPIESDENTVRNMFLDKGLLVAYVENDRARRIGNGLKFPRRKRLHTALHDFINTVIAGLIEFGIQCKILWRRKQS